MKDRPYWIVTNYFDILVRNDMKVGSFRVNQRVSINEFGGNCVEKHNNNNQETLYKECERKERTSSVSIEVKTKRVRY